MGTKKRNIKPLSLGQIMAHMAAGRMVPCDICGTMHDSKCHTGVDVAKILGWSKARVYDLLDDRIAG